MNFFTRYKDQLNIPDKAATGIANGILKCQRWFATSLQGWTKSWKEKQQWIFLFLICLVFSTMSTLTIVRPFKKSTTAYIIIPKSIRFPKNLYNEDKAFLITRKEFQQVQEYKNLHPDLMKEKPGLYDSLNVIEQAYYSQQK